MSVSVPNGCASITTDDESQACFVVNSSDKCAVLRASGEVDIATSPTLWETLVAAVDHCPRVVVDLSRVTFVDSTGLNVLVSGLHHAHESDGDLALVSPVGLVRNALHVTGLHRVFAIRDSVEAAVAAVDR